MRHQSRRCFFVVALSVLFLTSSPESLSAGDNRLVWFSDFKSIQAIDPETNTVAQSVELSSSPSAVALDSFDGGVWVLVHDRLTKFSAAGAPILSAEIERIPVGLGDPKRLLANPYNRSLWLAVGRELLQISSDGKPTARFFVPKGIDSVALDIDESLWVLADRTLYHYSSSGAVINSVDLKREPVWAERVAVDDLAGIIWVAGTRRLLRLNLNDLTAAPQVVRLLDAEDEIDDGEGDHGRKIRALDVHPIFGTLWVATDTALLLFDRNGAPTRTVALPPAIGRIDEIRFDAASLSLWVGGSGAVGRFTGNGDVVALIATTKDAAHLAVPQFILRPAVSIVEPLDGALTNNPRPPLRLSLGSQCTGAPCLLPDAYVRSLDTGADLNGVAIGPDFVVNGAEANYNPPTRLPEGSNRLTVRATDLFGHASDEASSKFTIDTIPPKFISVAPADGTILNKGTVVVSGSIDDATANVILGDGNGQGISMTSGPHFSFAIILKAGLNRFVLTARDPAGNESSVPLRINYNPVSVTITSPASGGTLTSRGAVITGNFEGPLNTGVTVNGTLAEISGRRFYVNLSLQPGSNTLTAVATTPEGATATDTVTVMVNAPAFDPVSIAVEPTSGVAPLTVRFTVTSNSALPVAQLSIDFDGDGSSDVVVANPTQLLDHVYTNPGVYQARVTATDGAGATSTQTIAIVVNDGQQMDQLFTMLWGGMNDALVHGDITTAVSFLNESAKRKYQPVFEALKPNFPQIVAAYSPPRRVSISSDIGEYAIVRSFNGQNRLYLIYFLRDADGVWRVDAM